jgi:hypothetical protein
MSHRRDQLPSDQSHGLSGSAHLLCRRHVRTGQRFPRQHQLHRGCPGHNGWIPDVAAELHPGLPRHRGPVLPHTNQLLCARRGYGPFSQNIGSIDETGRFATTTDSGTTWRLGRIAQYPFTALACPSISICYAAGYLGRLMGSTDGGTTWRDFIPALFVSGTPYGAKQPLHTYSPWFTATGPWKVTAEVVWEPQQGPGATNPLGCLPTPGAEPDVYVRNVPGETVAGPVKVKVSPQSLNSRGTSTIQVTGRLRLDVVSHCSTFSARVDGVQPVGG